MKFSDLFTSMVWGWAFASLWVCFSYLVLNPGPEKLIGGLMIALSLVVGINCLFWAVLKVLCLRGYGE